MLTGKHDHERRGFGVILLEMSGVLHTHDRRERRRILVVEVAQREEGRKRFDSFEDRDCFLFRVLQRLVVPASDHHFLDVKNLPLRIRAEKKLMP